MAALESWMVALSVLDIIMQRVTTVARLWRCKLPEEQLAIFFSAQ